MDGKTLLLILAGFAVVTGALVLALRLGHRYGGDVDLIRGRRNRPWWGHPGVWLLISAGFVFLGLFVFPKLFGFTFLFLPFLWVGGLWRQRPRDEEPPRDDGAPPRPDAEDRP
ncbi:MAG: hypothetical protein ACXVPR_10220 [Actinomycetota bacterium]|jgi:hypothetical protein